MRPPRRQARIAGALYLGMALTGWLGVLLVVAGASYVVTPFTSLGLPA